MARCSHRDARLDESFGRRAARSVATAGNRSSRYERPASRSVTICRGSSLPSGSARAIFAPLRCFATGGRVCRRGDDELNSLPFGAMPIDGVAADRPVRGLYAPSLGRTPRSSVQPITGLAKTCCLSLSTNRRRQTGSGRRSRPAVARRFDPVDARIRFQASVGPSRRKSRGVSRNFPRFVPPSFADRKRPRPGCEGEPGRFAFEVPLRAHCGARAFLSNDPERSMLLLNGAGPSMQLPAY